VNILPHMAKDTLQFVDVIKLRISRWEEYPRLFR
jgi:hypothetical protein